MNVAILQDSTLTKQKPVGAQTDKLSPQRGAEAEEEEGHLPGRCCSPSTVFFRGKGQRIR